MFRNNIMKTVVLACVLSLLAAAGCGQQEDPVGAATLQLKRKQYAAAIKTIRGADPKVRTSYAAQTIMARAYRGSGQHENSIKAYKRAALAEKGLAAPFVGMAMVEIEIGSKKTIAKEKAKHDMRAHDYLDQAEKVEGQNAEIFATRADLYEDRGELEDALVARKRAVDLDPENISRKLALANTHLRMGDRKAAGTILRPISGRNAEVLLTQARMLIEEGKPGCVAQAKSKLIEAEKMGGTEQEIRARILSLLASLSVESGDLEEAKEWLGKLEKFPRFRGQAMYQKGTILLREEKWKEAYEQFKLLENAKFPLLLMQLGFVEEKLNMPGQAVVTYEKIVGELAPRHVPAHFALARLQLSRLLYQRSMEHCKIILEERPDHEGALRIMARIHRMPSGKLQSRPLARICYLKILLHNPNSHSANLDIADLYLEQRMPDLAMSHAKRANAVKDTPRGQMTLGRAWLLRHQAGQKATTGPQPIKLAIGHMEKAYAAAGESVLAVVGLAQSYAVAEETNTSSKAVVLLREHISKNPRQGQVYLALADQLERMKDLAGAVKTMETAAGVRGIEGFSIVLLGRFQFLAGRHKAAIKTWEQALIAAGTDKVPVVLRFGLATALASDGQHAKAMTAMETALHTRYRKRGGSILLAACLAIQAGEYGRATQFIETYKYPSKKAKQPYLDFIGLCKKGGAAGKEAARLMCEGLMHSEFESFSGATDRFKMVAKRMPDAVVPLYVQIPALLRSKRSEEVPAIFKAIFKRFPEDGFAHYRFAMMKPRFPNEIDQRGELDTALDLDPQLADAHMALADIFLAESTTIEATDVREGKLVKALNHCEEAGKLLDGGTRASLQRTARVHYAFTKLRRAELVEETNPDELVSRLTRANESAAATRKFLRKLRDKYPSSLGIVRLRIRFELLEQEYAAAATMAGDFMKNQQSGDTGLRLLFIEALVKLGRFGGKPESLGQARAELSRMIKVDPLNIPAYRGLANLHSAMGRHDRVAQTLARMWAIDRSNVGVALKLANAYVRINRPSGAMAVYEELARVVDDDPQNPSMAALRRALIVGRARSRSLLRTTSEAERVANIEKAIEELAPLTRISVNGRPYVDAMLLRAELLHKLGKFDKALRLFEEAEGLAPKDGRVLRGLVIFHAKRGQFGKAVEVIQTKVIPQRKHDPFEYSRLGLALIARGEPGDTKAAVAAMVKARDLLSRRPGLQKELPREIAQLYRDMKAVTRIASRKFRDARTGALTTIPNASERTAYTRIIDGCSRNSAKSQAYCAQFAKFALFASMDENDEAIAHLKNLLKLLPKNYFILARLSSVYNRQTEMARVADVTEQQIAVGEARGSAMRRSDLRALYSELMSLYLVRLAPPPPNIIKRANAACERALATWPRDLALLNQHATIRGLQGNDAALIVALKRVTEVAGEGSPAWVRAHKRITLEYARMKIYDKCLQACDTIGKYVKDDASWQNNWAWLLAAAPNPDYDKAISRAVQAKRLNPAGPEIRDTLGWILHLAGRWVEADVELSYAARQRPNDPSVSYHLGANFVKLKKYKQAIVALERALELARNNSRSQFDEKDACKQLLAEAREKL